MFSQQQFNHPRCFPSFPAKRQRQRFSLSCFLRLWFARSESIVSQNLQAGFYLDLRNVNHQMRQAPPSLMSEGPRPTGQDALVWRWPPNTNGSPPLHRNWWWTSHTSNQKVVNDVQEQNSGGTEHQNLKLKENSHKLHYPWNSWNQKAHLVICQDPKIGGTHAFCDGRIISLPMEAMNWQEEHQHVCFKLGNHNMCKGCSQLLDWAFLEMRTGSLPMGLHCQHISFWNKQVSLESRISSCGSRISFCRSQHQLEKVLSLGVSLYSTAISFEACHPRHTMAASEWLSSRNQNIQKPGAEYEAEERP